MKKNAQKDVPQKKKEDQKDAPIRYFPIFMSIGISVGVAIGAAVGNIPVGMCIGLGVGTCLGSALDLSNRQEPPKKNEPTADKTQSPE